MLTSSLKKSLLLGVCLCLGLSAYAGRPKIGPGYTPGLGDGDGNTTTGGGNNTEVAIPIGLPETGADPSQSPNDPAASSNIVYTFDLSAENGAASANQTHSAFEKARDMNAACVLIRINGFAVGWDVAENIRQEILDYDKPVMVYVNNMSVPAADFISSGADNVYTKKGSTISTHKKSSKVTSPSVSNSSDNSSQSVNNPEATSTSVPNSSGEFSYDVTMNELLYKAGLGNLTVVEHDPGISERVLDYLVNPYVLLIILTLIGFVIRKTAKSKLPGPMMYVLAVMLVLYLTPFQLTGLASNTEIVICLLLVVSILVAFRLEKRWLNGILLVSFSVALALVRAGDTDALFQYTSASELATLPATPLGLVIVGWWIGKLSESRTLRSSRKKEINSEELIAAA